MFLLKGYGTLFYSDDEYYEGEFYADKRSGWGRMYNADGSTYEGEWFDDKQNGQGMLRLSTFSRNYCDVLLLINNCIIEHHNFQTR